jgi:xylulokinase
MNTVLGIDLGTQALKAVCYDFEAKAIAASESSPLDLYQGDGGVAEQQSHWWINALREAVGKIDPDIRASVRALAVSGQQHGFVALDESDEVLAPVKLWCDTSTEAECEEIMENFGGRDSCIEKVGNPILAGYTASKIRWLGKEREAVYRKLDCILLPHDYLNLYLTGERCMEAGDASGTGFLDIRERHWSEAMLRAIDPDRDLLQCLPPLRTNNETIGTLRRNIANELGLQPGIPVGIGGGDNMMGAIGTGNVRPGSVTMSLGTSGTVYAYADQPIIDPKGNIAAFCSSTGGWLPLLCTMNCTVTTELMRTLLGADIAAFESQISNSSRGADGVITLPFFNGERTPNLPNARGCIVGLNSQNTRPENILRSAVEGATYALKFGIEELESLGVTTKEIVVTGGGSKSPKWRQLVADICGAPATVLLQDEGAAFGAALQALQVIEGGSIEELTAAHISKDGVRSCEPRKAAVNFYKDSYQEYQRAVSAVSALYA